MTYATKSLKRFISAYPGHRLVPRAQQMLNECERIAFEHELYVADYYDSRDKAHGVVFRLEYMFKTFPERSVTEDNVLMLANAYAKTEQVDKAIFMYRAYLERFSDGTKRSAAQRNIDILRSQKSDREPNSESTRGS